MDINSRTLKSLEWERLKHYLSLECSCAVSREEAQKLELLEEREQIESLLAEGEEGLHLLSEGFELAQEGLPDLSELLGRLLASASLSSSELADIRKVLSMSRKLKSLASNLEADDYPQLRKLARSLHPISELSTKIDAVIDADGLVRDDASPLLKKLRREVLNLNARIKDELLRIINSPNYGKCLQEPIYTMRNGRHVLPVLSNMRHSIEGIVHDSSSSGLTIFVEPMSVVELTNSIRIAEAEIEREIERLLYALSLEAAKHQAEIRETFQTLVKSDLISARVRLARRYGGVRPQISNSSGELSLLEARHPLLVLQTGRLEAVVPNDIVLNSELRTLIITGPNTGGKTVYLKTAGLLCLMLRAGLLLPLAPGSRASVFSAVFADIGDEQSLEQNLSTFSSHMSNIVELIKHAGPSTLILLDEIGAGTDPREGVVLARVILNALNKCGARTICSTHYGELKTLAHAHSAFGNASMAFDDKTLSPSYRLRQGIAGSSRALEVAARLGLERQLYEEAHALLDSQKEDFERKIDELEDRLRAVSEKEEALLLLRTELEHKQMELDKKTLALDEELRRSRYEAANKFEIDYERARKAMVELTANLQKNPSLSRVQQSRERLEALKKELDWLSPEEYKQSQAELRTGQSVKVQSLGQIGVLEALPASAGEPAQVRIGRMKVKVALKDLQPVAEPPSGKKAVAGKKDKPVRAGFVREVQDPVFVRTSFNTLDLRGQRVDEGLAMLERFVDESYRLQLSPLMIIHGHGTGAMKQAVRDFLRSCSYKNKSRPGETYEGGDGVTVINFS